MEHEKSSSIEKHYIKQKEYCLSIQENTNSRFMSFDNQIINIYKKIDSHYEYMNNHVNSLLENLANFKIKINNEVNKNKPPIKMTKFTLLLVVFLYIISIKIIQYVPINYFFYLLKNILKIFI